MCPTTATPHKPTNMTSNTPPPILYATTLSANGRKVLAVSKQLNLQTQLNIINVYQGEGQDQDYLKINPFGKIPTLVDNQVTLWESNAIICYLAESYGHYRLTSANPVVRANIVRWLFWESSHWQPSISSVLETHVGHRLLPEHISAPTGSASWDNPHFTSLASYLNQHLSKNAYICGDSLTIADFSIAAMMTYFRFCDFPFDMFQNINRWFVGIEALDSWRLTEDPLWACEHE